MDAELDKQTIAKAYARWAPVYDLVFGAVFASGRRTSIAAAERIGGRPTLVLKRSGQAPLAITSVDNPGCLHELAERLRLAISGAVQM